MKRFSSKVVLVSVFLWPVATVAQDRSRLEEVQVTAGRMEQTTSDVAAGVSVVDTDALERQAPVVTSDLLRGVAGTFVQQTTPGQGIPIIRGLKGSEVLHLVDGMRLNNALFRNAPNQYLALVDARILSRVEVVRGPSPSLYGADAMGGVVQLVSVLPRLGEPGGFEGRLSLDYGSADAAGLGHLALSRSGKKIAYGVSASYQDVGDRKAGNNTQLTDSAFTSRAARAVLRALPRENHEWLFDIQYLRQPGTPRHDELVAGFGQTEPASAVFSFEPNQRLFAHARYQWHDAGLFFDDLELHAGFQNIRDDRRNRDTGSVLLRRERNQSDLFGVTLQLHSKPADRHALTYGAEAYFDEVSSSRTETNISTGEMGSVGSRFPDGSTMDSLAFYVHDEIALGNRMTLDIGTRYSHVEVSLPPADRGIAAAVTVDDLTGNVGATYDLTPVVTLVANLGRGFRAPNIFDLGTLGPRPGNRFNTPNPGLRPEAVVTADIGVKFAGARFIGEVFLWNADYRDKITSVLTGEIDDAGRSIVQPQNATSVDLWGFEAGARLLSDDERIEFAGVLNYTRGRERNGSIQPADRIPPLNGRGSVLYRIDPGWWVEGSLRFASSQNRLSDRDIDDPRIDPAGTPGWLSANLAMGWQVSDALELTFRLDNLLDKRYREHGSGIDAPGRNLGLGIEARF